MAGEGGDRVGGNGWVVGAIAGSQAAIVNKRINLTNGWHLFILTPSSENGSWTAKCTGR
jgi:hypothetical protein